MKRIARWIVAIAVCLATAPAAAQDYVPSRLLVKFKPNLSQSPRAYRRLHPIAARYLDDLDLSVIQLAPAASVTVAVRSLRSDPDVVYAEPDYVVRLTDVNDPFYRRQWDLTLIRAPAAWGITRGSPNVLVAMLDTGVDFHHPDLFGQIAGSRNFVGTGPAQDGNGHGTHTAGTVAAATDNGIGVASLGYRTRLLAGKVITDAGQGDLVTVAQGIEWAITSGAKVINMSLGLTTYNQTIQNAVDDAWNHGIVVVASAGNNGTTQPFYPAAFAHCIAVAATDQFDERASFSSFGSWAHVAAPGKDVLSLYTGGALAVLSGTSMAAPHVSALAALLWANGARSNLSIRRAIENSGDPTTGFSSFPVLRMNALRALMRVP